MKSVRGAPVLSVKVKIENEIMLASITSRMRKVQGGVRVQAQLGELEYFIKILSKHGPFLT